MAGAASSLKEYLKRYGDKNEEEKKKKKKKRKAKPDPVGVVVVDEDPVWQKPVELEEDDDDLADEEKPLVDEDIEVKRMKRLELLRSRRPFGAISEDGSGWVSVSDTPKLLNLEDQNSDISPPRKVRVHNDTPPRLRADHEHLYLDDLKTDLSPPRKRRSRNDSPSPEPHPRASSAVVDLSPPRKQKKHHNPSPEPETGQDPDISPPRRCRPKLPDMSPPRQSHRASMNEDDLHGSRGADISPPRKGRIDRIGSRDLSSRQSRLCSTEIGVSRVSSVTDISPPRNVRKEPSSPKEQRKTGLISGQDIKEENAKTKKDDWERYKDMDPSVSGRGAEPVYRDKVTGARVSKEELMKLTKKDEKPKEIKLEWGKGLAQKREAEERQLEMELEKDKPFARTRDDPELDKMMKERIRWGDPMAHLVKRKQFESVLPDLGDDEKMKESGFVIPQDIPSHSWLRRGLEAAPNRYGIKPGRHWDGVDRSTGYEKELFKRTNEKRATEREAYLWSVSDM